MNPELAPRTESRPLLPNVSISKTEFLDRMSAPGVHEFTGTIEMESGKKLWLSMVKTVIDGVTIEMLGTLSSRSQRAREHGVAEVARAPEEVQAFHLSIRGENVDPTDLCYDGGDFEFARKMVADLAGAISEKRLLVPMGPGYGNRVTANMEIIDSAAGAREEFTVACIYRGRLTPV